MIVTLSLLVGFGCENTPDFNYQPYGEMIWMGDPIQLGSENMLIKVAFEKDTLIARIDLRGEFNFYCYHQESDEIYIRGHWAPNFGLNGMAEVFDRKGIKRKIFSYYFDQPSGGVTFFDNNGEFIKYEYRDRDRMLIEFFAKSDSFVHVDGFCPIIVSTRKVSLANDSVMMYIHTACPPGHKAELVYFPEFGPEDSVILLESPESSENFSILIEGSKVPEEQLRMKYYLHRGGYSGIILRECSFVAENPKLSYE